MTRGAFETAHLSFTLLSERGCPRIIVLGARSCSAVKYYDPHVFTLNITLISCYLSNNMDQSFRGFSWKLRYL